MVRMNEQYLQVYVILSYTYIKRFYMLKAYIITEFATKIFFYIKNNTVLCN